MGAEYISIVSILKQFEFVFKQIDPFDCRVAVDFYR